MTWYIVTFASDTCLCDFLGAVVTQANSEVEAIKTALERGFVTPGAIKLGAEFLGAVQAKEVPLSEGPPFPGFADHLLRKSELEELFELWLPDWLPDAAGAGATVVSARTSPPMPPTAGHAWTVHPGGRVGDPPPRSTSSSPEHAERAQRLVRAREIAGLTIAQAASAVGWPRSILMGLESGRAEVDDNKLIHLAKVYGPAMALAWLQTGDL